MEKTMKYTPGPWGYSGNVNCYKVGTINGNENIVAIIGGQNTVITEEANARLIAAAPEMVELLESMLDLFNPYTHCIKGNRAIEVIQSVVSVLNKIKGV